MHSAPKKGEGLEVESRYRIVVEKRTATFKVVCVASGEVVSKHKSHPEAKAAMVRYRAADRLRQSQYYAGDMS